MSKGLNVLITGATGNIGSGVLYACLRHPSVRKVRAMTRHGFDKKHNKLVQMIHDDLLDYSKIEDKLTGLDACYWCLGVSQSKVRKKEAYHRITYDFTMEAAKVLERHNPGMTFCFTSGLGTDQTQRSRWMWARVKGKAEKDLGKFDLKVYNFRPGFVHPIKGEKSSTLTGSLLYPFIKNSKKYCVEADEYGLAMINATLFGYKKSILENTDIRELAKRTK